jgi:hypothetical protein
MTAALSTMTTNTALPVKLLVHPRLFPLAERLNITGSLRLWDVARHHDQKGSGEISVKTLFSILPSYGITYSLKQYRRLIAAGLNHFWTPSKHDRQILKLMGVERVNNALVRENLSLEDEKTDDGFTYADVIDACKPALFRVYVDPSGTIYEYRHRRFEALIASFPDGEKTVSRAFLARLCGVHRGTTLNWEYASNITKRANYEQSADKAPHNEHAVERAIPLDQNRGTVMGWVSQLPNTYSAVADTHQHIGQERKARRAFNAALKESDNSPVGLCADGKTVHRTYITKGDRERRLKAAKPGTLLLLGTVRTPRKRQVIGIFERVKVWGCETSAANIDYKAMALERYQQYAYAAREGYAVGGTQIRHTKCEAFGLQGDSDPVSVPSSETVVSNPFDLLKKDERVSVANTGANGAGASGAFLPAPRPVVSERLKERGSAIQGLTIRLSRKAHDLRTAWRNGSRQPGRAAALEASLEAARGDYRALRQLAIEYGVSVPPLERPAEDQPKKSIVPQSVGVWSQSRYFKWGE